MKKSTLIAIASLIVLGVVAHIAKSENDSIDFTLIGPTTADLEERLNKLELKLSVLETENEILKLKISQIRQISQIQSDSDTRKEGWKRRVFNGETYYIIPTSEKQN